MKQLDLKSLSTEELLKESKKAKSNYILFNVAYGIVFVVGIITTFRKEQKGTSVFIFLPIVFLPLILNVSKKQKAIKQELKLRNSEHS